MSAVIKLFIDICLLRKGPEDVPYSEILLGLLLALSIIISILVGIMTKTMQFAVISTIAELFFSFVFIKLLLSKKPERFLQTFVALLGASTLLNLIYAPAVYIFLMNENNKNIQTLVSLLTVALLVWSIAVYGHIFSRALQSPMVYGVAISIAYVLMGSILLVSINAGTVAS